MHARGLVAADVVADHMNLLFGPLAGNNVGEEGHELLAGMARRRLGDDFPGCRIERSEQAQRAVALVFEAVALGAPGRRVGLSPTGKAPPLHGARHERSIAVHWRTSVEERRAAILQSDDDR